MSKDKTEQGAPVGSADTLSVSSSDSSSSVAEPPVMLESIKTTESRRPHAAPRRGSVTTVRSNLEPYEALEHAYSADVETEAERAAREPITYTKSGTSVTSVASRPPDFEVFLEKDDDPRQWPLWYRAWILGAVSYSTWVIVLYSTCYTASIPGLVKEFDSSTTIVTLGLTTYLLGLAVGSLVVAPLSELFGRQIVYMVCLTIWFVLIIPCALAKSLVEILVVRFFGAVFGAAMISNSPGTVVDIAQPEYMALTMSLWSIAPLNGPSVGPIIGGFVYQHLGWRWDNWIVLILGGAGVLMMTTVKETYAPFILNFVFTQKRGWEPGISGLSFVGIGVGTLLAIACEPLLRRLVNAQPRDPETGRVLPEATALVMAIGAILAPLGQLVFAWTCLPKTIHWAIPIAFGVPFGAGNSLCFIYGANYLASTYTIYAASALAGNAVIRSIFGGVLPLAGPRMYKALSPQWAGTLLGLLEVIMIPIPFVLWRYGTRIRAKSPAVRQLREEQEQQEAKRAKWKQKEERRQQREAAGQARANEKGGVLEKQEV